MSLIDRSSGASLRPHALVTRRALLQLGAVTAAATCTARCMPTGGDGSPDAGDPGTCDEGPSDGADAQYCLTEPKHVRVAGAASLAVGQAVLMNVDDNTGVIVARDSGGVHALSAVCTHACCLVSLCGNAACSELSTSPGACEQTDVAEGDPASESIVCPCHGSTFRLSDGAALTGPATTPLPSYAVTLDGDDVVVDTAIRVDAAART